MPSLKSATDQLKQFWTGRSGRQKAMLLGGAGATAALLFGFVRMIGAPEYKPLFTGLEPADAQALSAKLDAMGIAHETSSDGKTLSVPADKLDAARMQTATDGQPHSGRMGFELFDKASWGQTEFDEKVNYQRALEGELERSIQTLADVDRARVHLVMATDSAFVDRQRDAKASVILKLHRGTLSKDAAVAISHLVSGAVDGLKAEDVSIVDADSARSLGIGQNNVEEGPGSGSDLSARLIKTLEPVVGADKIRASVNVDYDQGSTDESDEKYDPAVSALLSMQRSEDQAGGAAVPAGVPGTSSNVSTAQAPKPSTPASASQSSKTESAQYGVNRTVVHTLTPAGRVRRITAAILVDDVLVKSEQKGKTTYSRKKRSPQELSQIRELAEAVIGFDSKRGDSITVQNLSFDADASELDSAPITWANQAQKAVTSYSPILRPVSLLVLFVLAYLFLLRPVQKQVLVATPALPPPVREPVLPPAPAMGALPGIQPVLGEEAIRASRLREGTAEMVKQKPLQTSRTVQAWLREETT